MSKQFEELLDSFTASSPEEQLARIEKIRDTRSIERPAVARRRRKKEKSKSDKAKTKLNKILSGLSPEQRELFLKKLEKGNGES